MSERAQSPEEIACPQKQVTMGALGAGQARLDAPVAGAGGPAFAFPKHVGGQG